MQIAHPEVARGVGEHSSYQHNRTERLLRTLRSTLAIAFGTREQALAAARGVNRLHASVAGEGYRATDPELLAWVLSTLIDSALEMHERFLGNVSPEFADAYFRDMGALGSVLGVPQAALPPSVGDLRGYVASMCERLQVSQQARGIARELFAPLPGTGPAMLLMRQLTAGLLPPHLRDGFGLRWGPLQEAELRVLQALSRRTLPRLPLAIRMTPHFLLPEP